jgi:hypothetical protein
MSSLAEPRISGIEESDDLWLTSARVFDAIISREERRELRKTIKRIKPGKSLKPLSP